MPPWNIAVFFVYAMRRVDCLECTVTVELSATMNTMFGAPAGEAQVIELDTTVDTLSALDRESVSPSC